MRQIDRIVGAVLVLLAGVILWAINDFPTVERLYQRAGLYPGILAVVLALFGLFLILSPSQGGAPKQVTQRPLEVLGLLILYSLAVFYVGVGVSTLFFLTGLIYRFGRPLKSAAGIALVFTAGIYLLFFILLQIPAPEGLLF